MIDVGLGFPSSVIGRIGDPFVSARRTPSKRRPGYEGMGLGLFIAKTLLERSGAEMTFANGRNDPVLAEPERSGATIEARWRRDALGNTQNADRAALGENVQIKQ